MVKRERYGLLVTLVFIVAATTSGCGLVFQGLHETVRLTTDPPDARVDFGDFEGTSPTAVRIRRRGPGYRVLRVTQQGYHPACQLVECGTPRFVKVLDSIPAAIPLLIDLSFGTLQKCGDAALSLEPVKAGDIRFALPSDDEILQAWAGRRADLCLHPYLYDADFAKRAERIIVTAGGLQRRYEEVGPVDFGRLGSDTVTWVTIPIGDTFTYTHVVATFSQATPAEVNELMRRRALRLYGNRVDAVINVAYQTNPAHDVFATGLGVRFVADEARPSGASERLEELRRLLDKGLINRGEYERKRAEVLRGL